MTPARLRTIEEIYRTALDQEPDQIRAFLDTACEGDEVLRRKVEALLASRERAGNFIETSVVGLATRIIENGQADLLVCRTIGHYKMSKRIGTGGMGDVYLATDMTAGRKAALKLLPMRFTADAERLKRFQQEAHAVVGLNHPNILTVYEIGEDHSTHYIASELIEGETLRQRLMRGRIEVGEAVDIAIQVASALAAAHETGIVHRDIKPENIMIRRDGYVKVLDFGIAKLTETSPAEAADPEGATKILLNTTPGMIMGTVTYMSPEQARGIAVGASTDIWSLGVVLYEMLTGHKPFEGRTMSHVIVSILEQEPPPLAHYLRLAPDDLQRMLKKVLHKERDERYQTVDELLIDLKNLKREWEFQANLKSEGMLARSLAQASGDLQTPVSLTGASQSKAPMIPHNLPAQLTALIGRETESGTVKKLLQGRARLVTLTGPGGTGKTRLSLEVGSDLLNDFADGVFFVTLSSISDSSLVVSAIAKTLGVRETSDRPVAESLKHYLSDKQMLLLLDK